MSSLEELAEELRRKWGRAGGRIEIYRPGGTGMHAALVVVLPQALPNPITRHELTGETAELVWWQRDCRVIGFGVAVSAAAAAEQAMAAADRGELARRDVTVWFDRATRKFRFFRRDGGQRSEALHRPLGREIRAGDASALVC